MPRVRNGSRHFAVSITSTTETRHATLDSCVIRTKGVTQPDQVRRRRIAIGDDSVEAAWCVGELAMRGKEHLRGMHDFATFVPVDRVGAIAETGVAAIAHLDEGQRVAVAHDQIDFATAIVCVHGDPAQARREQVEQRGSFDQGAARAAIQGIGPDARYGALPKGTTLPSLNVDHAGVREMLPKPSRRSVPVAPCTLPSACVARRSR